MRVVWAVELSLIALLPYRIRCPTDSSSMHYAHDPTKYFHQVFNLALAIIGLRTPSSISALFFQGCRSVCASFAVFPFWVRGSSLPEFEGRVEAHVRGVAVRDAGVACFGGWGRFSGLGGHVMGGVLGGGKGFWDGDGGLEFEVEVGG